MYTNCKCKETRLSTKVSTKSELAELFKVRDSLTILVNAGYWTMQEMLEQCNKEIRNIVEHE
jgi:hypothetical protein